jgi:hypothetical protein
MSSNLNKASLEIQIQNRFMGLIGNKILDQLFFEILF